MKTVAIVSDSHIPTRAQEIPGEAREQIQRADHTIHAGDLVNKETLTEFQELSNELTAVSGNMDGHSLGLPGIATAQIEETEFIVTHGTGNKANYLQRVLKHTKEAATTHHYIAIAGHTHEVLDKHIQGTRLLNPGSCTAAAPADTTSMMTATVTGTQVEIETITDF